MITFTFNGLDFASYMRVNEIKGRGITPSDVSTISVPGMTGAHAGRKTRLMREITITFTVVGSSLTNLRDRINTLSGRLDLDEVAPLVFSDEPDKTYFAILAGASDDEEIRTYGFGTITFLCPDPYKYGPERIATLNPESGSIVNVAGTAPTKPIFDLETVLPSTYAMVANDKDEYNMIGTLSDVDTTKYTRQTHILGHGMQNVTNWTAANPGDVDHAIGGTIQSVMVSGDHVFTPNGFGTGTSWHGPAIKRSMPEPLIDFKVEAHFEMHNASNKKILGNLEMYLLDVNGNCVARIGLRDGFSGTANTIGSARLGPKTGINRKELFNTQGDRAGVWNSFKGVVRLMREGNKWTAYIGRVDEKGKHHTRKNLVFYDTKGIHSKAVTQVVFAMQQHGTAPVATMRVSSVDVWRFNPEQDGTPEIAYPQDSITFDHNGKGHYLVNGEDAKRFKNFGAAAFNLHPGTNTIVVEPGGAFTGTVRWRDAYK